MATKRTDDSGAAEEMSPDKKKKEVRVWMDGWWVSFNVQEQRIQTHFHFWRPGLCELLSVAFIKGWQTKTGHLER